MEIALHRNNVIRPVRKRYLEFTDTYEEPCCEIIVDATTHLRQSNVAVDQRSDHATAYNIFLDYFMPAIKGTTQWNELRNDCVCRPGFAFDRTLVTLSDKGFLLLCIDNYSHVWDHAWHQSKVCNVCTMLLGYGASSLT